MPCINFTVRKIDSLRAPDRGQVDYWDTGLPGFGIRVSQGGRKSWVVMYRVGRRKRRLTLGSYPPMTLAEARKDAKAALVVAQKGGDPAHGAGKLMPERAQFRRADGRKANRHTGTRAGSNPVTDVPI